MFCGEYVTLSLVRKAGEELFSAKRFLTPSQHRAAKQEESELVEQINKLERDRNIHVRELKRLRDEDSSGYNSHPILHNRYLLLSLLGKGGFSEVFKVGKPCSPLLFVGLGKEWKGGSGLSLEPLSRNTKVGSGLSLEPKE